MSATAVPRPAPAARALAPGHERFPLLDGVRGLAALTIFAFHVAFHLGLLGGSPWVARYLGNLNVGVPVFFVLSGFLLYRPFVAARLAGHPGLEPAPYLARRALRIVPAYWVALPIVALALAEWEVFTPKGAVTYFGFLQIYGSGTTIVGGIGQAWTLCVEVAFYLALPVWALLARRLPAGGGAGALVRGELLALGALLALSLAWKLLAAELLEPGDRGYLSAQIVLPAFADQFALGMGLAVLSAAAARGIAPPAPLRLLAARPWIAVAAALGLYAILGLRFGGFGDNWADAGPIRHEIKGLIGLLLIVPAVFGTQRGGRVRGALGWRPLLWLGVVSYSFYLWHLMLIRRLDDVAALSGIGWGAVAAAALLATVLVAWLSHRLVEAPGIALGRRWARALGGRRRGWAAGADGR